MQDRYSGDVGDLGKLGMLRCMEGAGPKVGINILILSRLLISR